MASRPSEIRGSACIGWSSSGACGVGWFIGVAAGSVLVFLGVGNELTATLLLSPLGTRTLSTGFWALTSEIDYVAAAPYAMLMIVISLPLTAVLYVQSKKIAGL